MEMLNLEQELTEQCLPGTWDYYWKDTGRHEGCDRIFYYGKK